MKGFVADIEKLTLDNEFFRKVVFTSTHCQLVVMNLEANQDIGMETHPKNDQFIRCEKGEGRCTIDGNEYTIESGFAIIIPAGAKHNITNTSSSDALKLYTLYSPPHHKDGTIHETKHDAEVSDEEFDGKTSEL